MKQWSVEGNEAVKKTYDPQQQEYVVGGFGGFDTLLKKYAPTAIFINAISTPEDLEAKINEIITKNHIKKLETVHRESYQSIITSLAALKEEMSNATDINEINDKMNQIFNQVFPQLEVEVYSLPDSGIDITKTLKSTHGFNVKNQAFDSEHSDLKLNGHGVIRQAFFSFLATLDADVSQTKKEYLILFEEPELYLHPESIFALRKQLYELAVDSPFQILCATHSPLMIDTAQPHSSLVRLVKDSENGKTKAYQVKFDIFEDQDKEYLQMLNRFNPHICECFYADEVVLVEGDTEAVIYRELISKYYSNQRDIFILNTGSKANLVFYQKILTHFGIKHVVVHDIDDETYKDRNGVEKLNAMWVVNDRIWEQIEESNREYPNLARRFIHYKNFEDAHSYSYNKAEGKPLSAFKFAQTVGRESTCDCIRFLDDLFGEQVLNYSQEELLQLVQAKKAEELEMMQEA